MIEFGPIFWGINTALAVSGSAAAYVTLAPRCAFWGPIIFRGERSAPPRVAITFDDGPDGETSPVILDTLKRLDVKAAFFVVGRNVDRWPDLVRRMDAEGHVVANHTVDHSHYGMFRRNGYWDSQLRRVDESIEKLIGRKPAMFRPPMGVRTGHVATAARMNGLKVITWTRRALDGIATSPEKIIRRIVPRAEAGDILLLHDGVEPHVRGNRRATAAAMEPMICGLRERGFSIVRLDELVGLPPYKGNAEGGTRNAE